MEEHLVVLDAVLDLHRSRARLRTLLLPDADAGRVEADAFPRSTAMRVLMIGLPMLLPALARLATRSRPLRLLADVIGQRLR